ncbi:MAG: hypothetical protein KGH64_01425 [Candidatus Micrarchaeota archaeon]|nr:hypothetical protein [Candidatus Micrarchaeota archaeon]MDE1858972.1 hypothetical protein [Candidatus Micrarchaeota archaeon]
MTIATKSALKRQFEGFSLNSSGTLYVSEGPAGLGTTRAVLLDNALRPITFNVLLQAIDRNSDIKEFMKGKWAWLAGRNISEAEEGDHNWDSGGRLTGHIDMDLERTIQVWPGSGPISMDVIADAGAKILGKRYYLFAGSRTCPASLILGLKRP